MEEPEMEFTLVKSNTFVGEPFDTLDHGPRGGSRPIDFRIVGGEPMQAYFKSPTTMASEPVRIIFEGQEDDAINEEIHLPKPNGYRNRATVFVLSFIGSGPQRFKFDAVPKRGEYILIIVEYADGSRTFFVRRAK